MSQTVGQIMRCTYSSMGVSRYGQATQHQRQYQLYHRWSPRGHWTKTKIANIAPSCVCENIIGNDTI